MNRAEELVQAMDRDTAFRSEVEAAPTAAAKRQVVDARGYQDVGLDDMKAYVESKGGKLAVPEGGRELTDKEMSAVSGGLTDEEGIAIGVGVGGAALGAAAAAV